MPERASLTQSVQVGVESVPGTPVAANKQFQSIGIEPAVSMEPQRFRAMGSKFATIIVPGKEWVEADLSGIMSYSELLHVFSSVLKAPGAPVTVDGSGRKWTFSPAYNAEDTVKTFTVEQGGAVRAHSFAYGLVTDLELTLNRNETTVGGTMIGQRISDGITMTGTPTALPQVPVIPNEIDVYLDTTSGGLGSTKLVRVLEATINISSRFNPVWVLNSANNSYVAHVEVEPTCEIVLLVEADAEGMGFLTQMRGGTTKFMRIKCLSPTLAGDTTEKYSLTWDAAVKVREVGDFSDEDGVYAVEWTLEQVYDAAWGKAFTVDLVNKETAL